MSNEMVASEDEMMDEIHSRIKSGQDDMNLRSQKIREMDELLSKAIMSPIDFSLDELTEIYWNDKKKKLCAIVITGTDSYDLPLIEHKAWVRKYVTDNWGTVLMKIKECL